MLRMNLSQDVIIAFSINNSDKIQISHCEGILFPRKKLPISPFQRFSEKENDEYINLFLAGYKAALLNFCSENKEIEKKLKGINIYIDVNIPIAKGFNCSTAYLLATGLTALKANNLLSNTDLDMFYKRAYKYEEISDKLITDKLNL